MSDNKHIATLKNILLASFGILFLGAMFVMDILGNYINFAQQVVLLLIYIPLILYLPFGIFPAMWYFSREQASQWYLLIPLIGMGIYILLPLLLLGLSYPFGLYALTDESLYLFLPLMVINLLAIVASIVLTYHNPPPTPKNTTFRRLGIICFYIAYILNGPWWWAIVHILG